MQQRGIEISKPRGVYRGELFAERGAIRIQLEQFSGLGIFDRDQTGTWQSAFQRVVQMNADQVVPCVREADFLEDISLSWRSGAVCPGKARAK